MCASDDVVFPTRKTRKPGNCRASFLGNRCESERHRVRHKDAVLHLLLNGIREFVSGF